MAYEVQAKPLFSSPLEWIQVRSDAAARHARHCTSLHCSPATQVTPGTTGSPLTAGVREVQIVRVVADEGHTITGGTFRLSLNHAGAVGADPEAKTVTAPLPFDASAATVRAALEALDNVRSVHVSRDRLGPNGPHSGPDEQGGYQWTVTFDWLTPLQGDVPRLAVADSTINAQWTGNSGTPQQPTGAVQCVDVFRQNGGALAEVAADAASTFTLRLYGLQSGEVAVTAEAEVVVQALQPVLDAIVTDGSSVTVRRMADFLLPAFGYQQELRRWCITFPPSAGDIPALTAAPAPASDLAARVWVQQTGGQPLAPPQVVVEEAVRGRADAPPCRHSCRYRATGLQPGGGYLFRVRAHMRDGRATEWSPASAAAVLPQLAPPGTPTPPQLASAGHDHVTVAFGHPPENGARITGYQVALAADVGIASAAAAGIAHARWARDGEVVVNVTAEGGEGQAAGHPHATAAVTATFRGLRPGREYVARVRAISSAGASPWSAASERMATLAGAHGHTRSSACAPVLTRARAQIGRRHPLPRTWTRGWPRMTRCWCAGARPRRRQAWPCTPPRAMSCSTADRVTWCGCMWPPPWPRVAGRMQRCSQCACAWM